MLRLKRIYEKADPADGERILVDRLWPRGLTKADAKLDEWLQHLAPSNDLRRWFGHDPALWVEFQKRYRKELENRAAELLSLRRRSRRGTVTLLYAAADAEHNNAAALKAILESIGE